MSQNVTLIITIAIIIIAVLVRIWRMTREQRFGILTMWIVPGIFAVLACSIIIVEGFTTPLNILEALLALAVGAGIGWYQGTHTTVRIDRVARAMFVKISPIGGAIFIGVIILRMAIRMGTGSPMPGAPVPSGTAGASAVGTISILLLVLAVGVIAGLRAYLARAYHTPPRGDEQGTLPRT